MKSEEMIEYYFGEFREDLRKRGLDRFSTELWMDKVWQMEYEKWARRKNQELQTKMQNEKAAADLKSGNESKIKKLFMKLFPGKKEKTDGKKGQVHEMRVLSKRNTY